MKMDSMAASYHLPIMVLEKKINFNRFSSSIIRWLAKQQTYKTPKDHLTENTINYFITAK